ncbi:MULTISPECIES: methyltransferase [Spirulina sp. CCY15215]|uniref:50S ribosomal protein L11 methyltransferase n=1 Tax=Spirulina sp. CCY15215 TaxID=2767591 RepID=UPI001950D9F3|nr:methyltransferase [Spirulina major]
MLANLLRLAIAMDALKLLQSALEDKRLNLIDNFLILTDRLDYQALDQVFPIFAEQQFFLDELRQDKMQNAEVLEIGLGSGVLSIAAISKGAKSVTALEINPRAKNFAGFNFILNGVEDKITVLDGQEKIWQPVQERQFDYIISNPPFEPTPPGMDYFYHSAAGPYGLDFLDKIFARLDEYLKEDGHAQIVTAAPGNQEKPTLLLDLIQKYLSGTTTVLLNPYVLTFDEVMDDLANLKIGTIEQIDGLRQKAKEDSITHIHLCVIHYEKGLKNIEVKSSQKIYEQYWEIPVPEYQLKPCLS